VIDDAEAVHLGRTWPGAEVPDVMKERGEHDFIPASGLGGEMGA